MKKSWSDRHSTEIMVCLLLSPVALIYLALGYAIGLEVAKYFGLQSYNPIAYAPSALVIFITWRPLFKCLFGKDEPEYVAPPVDWNKAPDWADRIAIDPLGGHRYFANDVERCLAISGSSPMAGNCWNRTTTHAKWHVAESRPSPVAADAFKGDLAHDTGYRRGLVHGYKLGVRGSEDDYQKRFSRLTSEINAGRRAAQQPAPVAVVMPERIKHRSENPAARISYVKGWNACLDEVARLNGMKP